MLDQRIKGDIKVILDYLWHEEKRHYGESHYCKNHVFKTLKRLAKVIKYEPQSG